MKTCVRCQKPIPPEEHRRKFCSDACADSTTRERIKLGKATVQARRLFRFYPRKD
jgi:predicted nucleic acid-binding Zn ribbon protein